MKYIPMGRRGMGGLGRCGKTVELERSEGLYLEADDDSNRFSIEHKCNFTQSK
jgi:hypothetical protein